MSFHSFWVFFVEELFDPHETERTVGHDKQLFLVVDEKLQVVEKSLVFMYISGQLFSYSAVHLSRRVNLGNTQLLN